MIPLLVGLAVAVVLDVPFVPQAKDTCGAAALAMVMRYWEVPASHDEIAAALLEPQLQGIAGSRLEAFARERGLTALAYKGDAAHLREYLAKGRPLIVVVVGFDPDRDEVLVNDPSEGASRRVGSRAFEERWSGAGHWTLLVLPARR